MFNHVLSNGKDLRFYKWSMKMQGDQYPMVREFIIRAMDKDREELRFLLESI
jgi:hypothetical protein